ncbi:MULTISPECIES: DEAD/DEAH box helicase [Acinetobacter]|uniref:DEAD/DEAH box helicase n=1 Tax=Acinetobacter TaxID=469 RepID=UPI0022E72D49|nr:MULTISPECIES: helicase-related protein [Acinetobacter]MDI1223860.1 helicase-related protein [Acinetobacter sp.]
MLTSLDESTIISLKDTFGLILVDEGHAEPAPKWGNALRALKAKKIIITATPYRNDLFSFDIDVNYSFIYSYKNAVKHGVIVKPKFETVTIGKLFDKINNIKKNQPNSVCIVKCNKFSDIERYFSFFKDTFKTAAIHDQYKTGLIPNTFGDVPKDLKKLNYEVLIHQRMLDEGIDIPESKILVLTYAVGSGKELVQTIGRIVRVYEDYLPTIFELDSVDQKNLHLWNNYLEFDSYISNTESAERFLNTLDTASLIDSYLDAFPDYSYFGSSYRKKFNFDEFDPLLSLEIPLASVCFYYKEVDFNYYDCIDKLYWESSREGALTKYNSEIGVITSVYFNNSKFLKDSLFFEPSLEIMIIKELDNIIAIFDSRGRKFNGKEDLKIGRAIDVDRLFSIVSSSNHSTVTKQANTRALQFSPNKAEGVSLKGPNLEKTNHPQSNSSYAVTTTVVSCIDQNEKVKSSYYLGVASGRISDQKNRNFLYSEYIEWLDQIRLSLATNQKVKSKF